MVLTFGNGQFSTPTFCFELDRRVLLYLKVDGVLATIDVFDRTSVGDPKLIFFEIFLT